MDTSEILTGPSFLIHKNPKKLIFMLHGFGDNGENFINIANSLNKSDWNANYYALNAPSLIPEFPNGRQWFDIYPNGIYISDAGPHEILIIHKQILLAIKLIENTIEKIRIDYNLKYKDCFLLGFSQGGMVTFEFGNYFRECLAGLAILSGRIISEKKIMNSTFLKTPIFISHGILDEVIPINIFDDSCAFLEKNKMLFESHKLQYDTHTISNQTITLFQKCF